MPEAISAINLAGQFAPENKFVAHTAGELIAWYDIKADKTTLPDNAKAGLAKIRGLLGKQSAFTEAYDTALKALSGSAQRPLIMPESGGASRAPAASAPRASAWAGRSSSYRPAQIAPNSLAGRTYSIPSYAAPRAAAPSASAFGTYRTAPTYRAPAYAAPRYAPAGGGSFGGYCQTPYSGGAWRNSVPMNSGPRYYSDGSFSGGARGGGTFGSFGGYRRSPGSTVVPDQTAAQGQPQGGRKLDQHNARRNGPSGNLLRDSPSR